MNPIATSSEKPVVAITRDRQDVRTAATEAKSVDEQAPVESTEGRAPVQVDSDEVVESAIERNGREVVFGGRSIEFQYDKESGRVIVRVRSEDSGEILRQIPRDEYLKLAAQFKELAGLLFNETV